MTAYMASQPLLDGLSSPNRDFSNILSRLFSFKDFPQEYYKIFLTKLANRGFYYTLDDDKVRCFSCGLCLHVSDLKELDNISLIHQERSRGCLFISDFINQQNDIAANSSKTAFPDYFIGRDRITSLESASISHSLATIMAKNGLFFDKEIQKVRCFQCGKKINYHENKKYMEMHTEHAKKSPKCPFLRRKPVHTLTEWSLDGAIENANAEICPPSSTDVMLDAAACHKRMRCRNCQHNEKCITFIPCCHSCLCKDCCQQMRPKYCLGCQQEIKEFFEFKLANL
ncbi:E3 ubiquitin-protein ligase XIAP-like [Ylistrum balloti]|uniref:E3 ubiquitin-protein ligase XIAP-like n=1 Tax=Ylistrum balloti TaxID=509963 RepID=UPI0029058E0F|nr:E3 ubiquitin-protein ligase XIAP-like [Ylistrum balloti]